MGAKFFSGPILIYFQSKPHKQTFYKIKTAFIQENVFKNVFCNHVTVFTQANVFENVVCKYRLKMVAILFKPRCVNF